MFNCFHNALKSFKSDKKWFEFCTTGFTEILEVFKSLDFEGFFCAR